MVNREDLKVPVAKLRRVCDPRSFAFEDTDAVEPAKGFIGQPRAVAALSLGLEVDSPEYNIYVTSDTGVSRGSVLMEFLEEHAQKHQDRVKDLRDFCYVFNFAKSDEPQILMFKKGGGRLLETRVSQILSNVKATVPIIFQSEEYQRARSKIIEETDGKIVKFRDLVNQQALEAGFAIQETTEGYKVWTLSRESGGTNRPMKDEEYEKLDSAAKQEIERGKRVISENLETALRRAMDERKKANQDLEALGRRLVQAAIESNFKRLERQYPKYPEVLILADGLQKYVLDNINLFVEGNGNGNDNHNGFDPFLPFKVNVFVDNSKTEKIPVIFESAPTFGNLFGKIEKKFVQGGYATDHTCIKAGSASLADGGYLVLNVLDVLRYPGVLEKLEKTIRYGSLKIEEPMSYLGLFPVNLDPLPTDLRFKVILLGGQMLYHLLVQHDPEFSAIFKIKAELDSKMPLTPENLADFVKFIALCSQKEDKRTKQDRLLPFDNSAAAKVVECGIRLAGHQAKLSTEFHRIKDLIVESSHWAEKAGSRKVEAVHVKQALDARKLRVNLVESHLREWIKEGILLVDTEGVEVGQINGLVVHMQESNEFGFPVKITAQTFLGTKGVVSIDKDVKMSGPIHDKGVHIFLGYFGAKYGKETPVVFSASLCFEQSYSGVEGDSASAAELFCLVSSLSELPILQSFAVTGSVNQLGKIQPIGGVNEKIEGFFDVCNERGLTGNQGVIIPHQNVDDLMLREDVVQACSEGRFHIYAMKTVDEGMEILMNTPAAEIHGKVSARLAKMVESIKKIGLNDKAPNAS